MGIENEWWVGKYLKFRTLEYLKITKKVGYIMSVNITGSLDETVTWYTTSCVSVGGSQISVPAAHLGCSFLASRHTGIGGPIYKMRIHLVFF